MIYSKLLCEYTVVANTNDRFKATEDPGGTPVSHTITLTAGRYRDHIALATEIDTQLTAAFGSWTISVDNTTGIISATCNEDWDVDWNTSGYGTTLRDDLGFDGTETVDGSYALTGSSVHLGGFYPTEPIENDTRPTAAGTDTWSADTYQQEGRTGMLATKGGTTRVHDRSITILLPSGDLDDYELWCREIAKGKSFAYYHDRTVAWDGASNEYDEYKVLADGDAGIEYRPERLDGVNTIWHRATLLLQERVAPAT